MQGEREALNFSNTASVIQQTQQGLVTNRKVTVFIQDTSFLGVTVLFFLPSHSLCLLLALQKCLNDVDRATHPELKPNMKYAVTI